MLFFMTHCNEKRRGFPRDRWATFDPAGGRKNHCRCLAMGYSFMGAAVYLSSVNYITNLKRFCFFNDYGGSR
jgi:hypothetical protein